MVYLEATDGVDSTSRLLLTYNMQLLLLRLCLQDQYSALHALTLCQLLHMQAVDFLSPTAFNLSQVCHDALFCAKSTTAGGPTAGHVTTLCLMKS